MCELEKLALKAHPSSGGPTSSALSVKGIVQNLKRISKTMRFGSQEDAHEFFVQVGQVYMHVYTWHACMYACICMPAV